MNYYKLIKNNWKKSVFAASLFSYGAYSLKNHIEITNHMRNVCNSVLELERKSGYTNQPKSVLVILNPVANKKSAEKMFKKYCEPILHLAGYSVEIIKTTSVGHGKSLVESMTSLPDVIVCAGGDGTTSEVVTGLMRRGGSNCPIVLIPLGKTNKSAYKFVSAKPESKVDYLKCISNSILPLIQEKSHLENVIKFDVIDDSQEKRLKPIYGLNEFSWGILHDIENVKEKYWYFGRMKLYAAAILNSFSKQFNWNFAADFEASPPCPGCRNCFIQNPYKPQKSYLSKFLLSPNKDNISNQMNVENKTCNTITQGHIKTSQLKIACNRNDNEFFELETKAINSIVPGWEFIKNIEKITNDKIEPSFTLKSRTIQLFPVETTENNSFYSIDGEEYDVRPIKLSLIPKAIKIFS